MSITSQGGKKKQQLGIWKGELQLEMVAIRGEVCEKEGWTSDKCGLCSLAPTEKQGRDGKVSPGIFYLEKLKQKNPGFSQWTKVRFLTH